jgi:hypothetical protein
MQTIYTVIRDCGDGSQTVEWRKLMSDDIIEKLGENNSYQSGDGVQTKEYKFPDSFDIEAWAKINHISWADGYENEEY